MDKIPISPRSSGVRLEVFAFFYVNRRAALANQPRFPLSDNDTDQPLVPVPKYPYEPRTQPIMQSNTCPRRVQHLDQYPPSNASSAATP